jgi:hypothetical protein
MPIPGATSLHPVGRTPTIGGMDAENLVEVFRTDSPIAAQKVLDVILMPEGIRAVLHDREARMFPGAGKPGGVFIAVASEDRDRAIALITEAEQNGFLDPAEGGRV